MATIKHLFHIAAAQNKVFEAVTSIDGLKSWWTAQVSGSSDIGDVLAFRFKGSGMDFRVTSQTAGERVEWECISGFAEWIGTKITFALDQNEGKTRVRFEHSGWAATNDQYAAINFSWSRYMESLRQYCETGTGAPFTNS